MTFSDGLLNFLPVLYQGTNGHSDYYPTGSIDFGASGDLDIALILLNKKKVELENQLLKLQTIQVREKTRQVPTQNFRVLCLFKG
jgi:hypothetical protein